MTHISGAHPTPQEDLNAVKRDWQGWLGMSAAIFVIAAVAGAAWAHGSPTSAGQCWAVSLGTGGGLSLIGIAQAVKSAKRWKNLQAFQTGQDALTKAARVN